MEVHLAGQMVKWYAEEARRIYGRIIPARLPNSRMDVLKIPVGPVAAFSPWNFPLVLSSRKIGGALAAGCSIILKGAEETPASVAAMVDCFAESLPAGALQLVYGVPDEVSQTLIRSPIIRKVSFTGSVAVGRSLAQLAAKHLKRITLELGGHAPVLVFGDVDLERTVNMLTQHKFRNAGQACLAPTRFFIEDRIYQDFVDAFSASSGALQLGSGMDPTTQMGPVANARRKLAINDLVHRSVAGGANAIGFDREQWDSKAGYFVSPTLLTNLNDDSPAMVEEPFGPVVCLAPFHSVEHALEMANRSQLGLAGYLFTDSAKVIHQVSERLEVGTMAVNGVGVSVPEAPFGGVKDSGYGSESGTEGMEAYLDSRFMHYFAN